MAVGFKNLSGFRKSFGAAMKQELVENWMTKNLVTVTPHANLMDVHKLMNEKQIRRLPVIDHDKLVGIVTLGDVREAEPSGATTLSIWEVNYLISKLTIDQIMTRNPISITPKATIADAAKVMLDNKVSGLTVVDEYNHLVGIITESDIFRMVVQSWHAD
jgi:acetoin utilization protein AcuB